MKSYKELLSTLQESEPKQGKVETKKYSWGTMKTVHHGADFSIPLHPEHHQAISKLKDEQEHKFKDETGHHWVARRKGDHIHFDTTGNGSMKTHVPLHTMKEEYENVELEEETELTEWAVKHDGVDADHPSAQQFHGKKDVINHLTKYKDSAEKRAKLLKDKGFKNVRIEENVWKNWTKAYPETKPKDPAKEKQIRANKDSAILDAIRAKKEKEKKAMGEEVEIKEDLGTMASAAALGSAAAYGIGHLAGKMIDKFHQKYDGPSKTKLDKKYKEQITKNKSVKEELQEGKMGQIHADIEDHLGKHLADYKAHGGAEHFANKVLKTHDHIAKLHGLEKKHAASLVNQYVDSKLNEAAYAGLEKEDKPGKKKTEFKGGVNSVSGETVEGWKDEKKVVKEAVVQDLDKYFSKIEMKDSETKKPAVKKEPENTIKGSQLKFFNTFKEGVELDEKMNLAKASMGDVIKDFQKSDAPQFAGKSKEKRQQMAIAAKLEADRQQNEGVIQPTGDDSIDTGADNKGKTTYTRDKKGKLVSFKHEGEWKKATAHKDQFGNTIKDKNMAKHLARSAMKTVKEEAEDLEEAFINGREYASQGVMHPEHAKMHKVGNQTDFYAHGTGDKISGKVTHNDGKEVHFKADKSSGGATHKFKVSSTLPKPVNEELDEDLSKWSTEKLQKHWDTHKDEERPSPVFASQLKRVSQELAKRKKTVKEEIELDEAVESGNKGYGYHGQHESDVADKKYSAMHAKVKKVAGEAGHLKDAKKPNVMVKHYLDSRHGRHLAGNESDHEYIKKDFGKFKKSYKESDFAKEEFSIDDEGNFVVENKLTYEEFMSQLLEYTPGPGGVTRVQGRSYGAQYHDPEGDDDADDKPAKKAEQPKKGRGRPAGSKSGANVKRLSSKGSNGYGYDSTGYKLHLPNSNK